MEVAHNGDRRNFWVNLKDFRKKKNTKPSNKHLFKITDDERPFDKALDEFGGATKIYRKILSEYFFPKMKNVIFSRNIVFPKIYFPKKKIEKLFFRKNNSELLFPKTQFLEKTSGYVVTVNVTVRKVLFTR